jgi:FkbM family methyltransferase
VTSLVRALGLRSVAQTIYYWATKPQNSLLPISVLQRECLFYARDPIELRTVELSVESELRILELMLTEVAPGDVFLDAGANLGIFSIFAAAFGATVVSCEPDPLALARLILNRDINKCEFEIIPKALSDREGMVAFTCESGQVIQRSRISETGDYKVACVRGDSLGVVPNIVKIDVEGHELNVIRGLQSSLPACRLCVVEVHDGVDWKAVSSELAGSGFNNFAYIDGKLVARRSVPRGGELRDA